MTDALPLLSRLKRDIDGRITYDNSGTIHQLPDWTWVTAGSHGRGDCSVFAATYFHELQALGIDATMCVGQVMQQGRLVQHAWTEVAPYTLDCRFPDEVKQIGEGGYYELDGKPHSVA